MTDGDQTYANAEEDAYQILFANIRDDLCYNPHVLNMIGLKTKLMCILNGVEKMQESSKKHIRHKLESEFGESLLIFPDDNGIPNRLHHNLLNR